MITAIDSNIILDLLVGPVEDSDVASRGLSQASLDGSLIISAICFAEVAGNFPSESRATDFFELIRCSISEIDQHVAFIAGGFYRDYRKRGGERTRILPDFLIGAHAQVKADRMLTRDNRFFKATFPKLKAISPSELVTPPPSK